MSLSDTGTTSPPRGNALTARFRRNKGLDNLSTNSLAGSSDGDGDDAADSSSLRASMETAIGKVKDRTKRAPDDRLGSEDGTGRRLSALISRKKRNPRLDAKNFTVDRNFSTESGYSVDMNRSDSSLPLDESGHSSLLTEDNSDTEG